MHYKQLLLTLLVLLGLGQTLEVRADDFTYNANNYTCMMVGVDKALTVVFRDGTEVEE